MGEIKGAVTGSAQALLGTQKQGLEDFFDSISAQTQAKKTLKVTVNGERQSIDLLQISNQTGIPISTLQDALNQIPGDGSQPSTLQNLVMHFAMRPAKDVIEKLEAFGKKTFNGIPKDTQKVLIAAVFSGVAAFKPEMLLKMLGEMKAITTPDGDFKLGFNGQSISAKFNKNNNSWIISAAYDTRQKEKCIEFHLPKSNLNFKVAADAHNNVVGVVWGKWFF